MSLDEALRNNRLGMVHRTLSATPSAFIGVVQTAHWSTLWGKDACTADASSISFPRHSYAIELVAQKRRAFATPGNALLVNALTEFRRDAAYRRDVDNDFLSFAPSVLEDVIREWEPERADRSGALFAQTEVPLDVTSFRIQRLLVSYLLSTLDPDELVVEDVAILLLRRIVRRVYELRGLTLSPKKSSTRRAHQEAVEGAKEYIWANLDRALSLKAIGEAAGVSPTHFCGIFRTFEGQTIHGYVRDLRLRTAYDRLPDYGGNLTQLALEVGFANGNQFSTVFSGEFGEPPSAEVKRDKRGSPSMFLAALAKELDSARPFPEGPLA